MGYSTNSLFKFYSDMNLIHAVSCIYFCLITEAVLLRTVNYGEVKLNLITLHTSLV